MLVERLGGYSPSEFFLGLTLSAGHRLEILGTVSAKVGAPEKMRTG
jgi:hypothetical protein